MLENPLGNLVLSFYDKKRRNGNKITAFLKNRHLPYKKQEEGAALVSFMSHFCRFFNRYTSFISIQLT